MPARASARPALSFLALMPSICATDFLTALARALSGSEPNRQLAAVDRFIAHVPLPPSCFRGSGDRGLQALGEDLSRQRVFTSSEKDERLPPFHPGWTMWAGCRSAMVG